MSDDPQAVVVGISKAIGAAVAETRNQKPILTIGLFNSNLNQQMVVFANGGTEVKTCKTSLPTGRDYSM